MLNEAAHRQLLGKVLALAKKQAGAEAIVSLRSARTGNTRFAVNEITSSGDVDTQTLDVTIKFGKRSAQASTNQLDDRSLADVVARAARMAKLSPENPEAMSPADVISLTANRVFPACELDSDALASAPGVCFAIAMTFASSCFACPSSITLSSGWCRGCSACGTARAGSRD